MGKKLVSRTAKVLSETKKSRGKEAIAIAYEHIPRDPEEQRHGSLYAVIELEDAGGHAEEIAEKIIDILHNEYYEDTARTPLSAFENSLAKINEELAERSSEGQINWLGKLNAVLCVLSGSTLHMTQAGKAEAYLYRNDHALHVTEDLAGDSINPLRTFINVASGDLTEKDKLLFVTPGVFYKLSKSELKKYTTENSPKIAAENLSQLLSGETGNTLPNAILIMEMVSPESFAVEPEPEKSTESWVKEEKNVLEPVARETMHTTVKAFEVIGRAASGASTFISAKAFPALKTSAQKVSAGFKKDKEAPEIILHSEEKVTALENLEPESDGILESARDDLREIRISEKDTRPKILSLERFDFSFAKNTKDKLIGKVKRFKLFSFTYVIIGVVLIASLLGYFIYVNGVKKVQVASENNYNQAKITYEKAMAEIANTQREMALEDLQVAERLATEVKNGKYNKTEAEKLLAQIAAAKDEALGVIKNTAKSFASLGNNEFDNLYTDGSNIYVMDFEKGNVSLVDAKTGNTTPLIVSPTIDGKIKFATLVSKRKVIVAFTEKNEAYEFDLTGKKVTKQKVSGSWEDAVALDTYNSNLYLLSPSTSQIYKHLRISTGYGKGTKYFTQDREMTDAVDLAIDSDVFVLLSTGEIQKFTAGELQTFEINGLPAKLSGANDVFTSIDIKGLYVSNSDSIMQIDEAQNFIATFRSDNVKNIKGFIVNDTTKMIYILSEAEIFTISY